VETGRIAIGGNRGDRRVAAGTDQAGAAFRVPRVFYSLTQSTMYCAYAPAYSGRAYFLICC
jgi:hypothetical protein